LLVTMSSGQVAALFRRKLVQKAPRNLSQNVLALYARRNLTSYQHTRPIHANSFQNSLNSFHKSYERRHSQSLIHFFSTKHPEQKKEEGQSEDQGYVPTTSLAQTVINGMQKVPGILWDGTKATGVFLVAVAKDPKLLVEKSREAKEHTMDTLRQYWIGTKLLWSDLTTSRKIVVRMIKSGRGLTRRERNLLVRTTSDIFRLVPVAFFLIVPFMELALPFALKMFPNMLPSTFQDKLKKEQDMKKLLQARVGLNDFLQETLAKLVDKKKVELDGVTSEKMEDFMKKARSGYMLENEEVVQFAKFFPNDLLLDNLARPQLVNMCRYMGLTPYGSDNFLIFQLRSKFSSIIQDDQRILWEGINTLTYAELQEACQVRGMRHMGLTTFGYRRQLQQWIELSIKKEMPIALLIMSRAFNLDAKDLDPATALQDSIGALDDEVLDEVLLEIASEAESSSLGMRMRKLESIKRQNELIEEEYNKRLANKKKREKEQKRLEEEKKKEEAALAAAEDETKELEVAQTIAAVEEIAERAKVVQRAKETIREMAEPEVMKDIAKAEPVIKEVDIISEVSGEATEKAPAAKKQELSLEELQSLESIVEKDLVSKEKAALEEMKAKMETLKASEDKLTEKAEVIEKLEKVTEDLVPAQLVEEPAEPAAEDKPLDKMTSKLTSMLDKLELDIKQAEEKMLDAFDALEFDKDNDGILSRTELEDVLKNVLKTEVQHEALEEIIDEIDKDADGVLSVMEVQEWIRHKLAVEEAKREALKDDVEEKEDSQENEEASKENENVQEAKS